VERDRQSEAVETISAQVVGLGEITSMNKQQKGTREMRQEALILSPIRILAKRLSNRIACSGRLLDTLVQSLSSVGPVVKGVA